MDTRHRKKLQKAELKLNSFGLIVHYQHPLLPQILYRLCNSVKCVFHVTVNLQEAHQEKVPVSQYCVLIRVIKWPVVASSGSSITLLVSLSAFR